MKTFDWRSAAVGAAVFACIGGARAEEGAKPGAEPPKPPAEQKTLADNDAARKQHGQEEMQKRMAGIKTEIAECEKQIQSVSDMIAGGKNKERQILMEKRLAFLKQTLGLLQQVRSALEAGNGDEAMKLREQVAALRRDWSISGEMTAQFESEKARLASKVGADASPELKAAVEAYTQACDALLAKTKELRELEQKQGAARRKVEELMSAVRKPREHAEEKKAAN